MELPVALINALSGIKDFDAKAFIDCHIAQESVTSIRINTKKIDETAITPEKNPVPWAVGAFYLKERPSFTLDPLLHAGCYYVQEASSMFLEQLFLQLTSWDTPLKVLDLCAAPGGKSTHILSLLQKDSFLVSNEVIPARNAILEENLTKWGDEKAVVTQNDAKDFAKLGAFFDVIVIDAPCSGSGLFRKDNLAIKEWSKDNVTLCCQRQKRILADVLPALKEDGLLIYSTCSYAAEENEDIMDWLQEAMKLEPKTIRLKPEWNISTVQTEKGNTGYRFWPYLLKGEGFFITAFQNRKQDQKWNNKQKTKSLVLATKEEEKIINHWIEEQSALRLIKHQDSFLALQQPVFDALPLLKESLYIKRAGILIGEAVKNALIPSHALALSNLIKKDLPAVTLGYREAIDFLKKNEFSLPHSPKGWLLVKFNNHPIGLLKNLGNRINNYYPKNWRILRSGK